MKYYKLETGAGDAFNAVAKQAQELSKKVGAVEFEFNGVRCLVTPATNLTNLYRDYSNSWTMGWKEVGPICDDEYSPELQKHLDAKNLQKEKDAEEQRKEWRAQEQKEREALELIVKDISIEIIEGKEDEYAKYVRTNSDDGYGQAVIEYSEAWAKLMQVEISKGRTVVQVADETQKGLGFFGITGFQYGCAVKGLAHFWKHGEELRKWHNKSYGYEGTGTVNPAILTISK